MSKSTCWKRNQEVKSPFTIPWQTKVGGNPIKKKKDFYNENLKNQWELKMTLEDGKIFHELAELICKNDYIIECWRDGSAVKNSYSSTGYRSNFQFPHGGFTTICNSSSRESDTLFWLPRYQAYNQCTDIHADKTLIHNKIDHIIENNLQTMKFPLKSQ